MTTDTVSPVVVNDTASIALNSATQATGDVLTNDVDGDGDTLTVATVNGAAGNVGTTLTGLYGTLVLKTDGTYTYLVNSTAAQGIALGQTVSDVFHYTVTDGRDHSVTTTTVTDQNLITRSEAFDNAAWVKFADSGTAPTVTANVAVGPQGTAATADQVSLTGVDRGLYFESNVSGQYTFSVWVKLVSGSGALTLNYYGASTDVSQAITATSAWQRVSLTFNGTGDPTANVALMHGDGQSATGVFQFWGAQLNSGASANTYLPTTGAVVQTTTTTTTTPTFGADLTVSLSKPAGTPDAAPTANADAAGVKVGVTTQATGNVLTNDTDPEHDPLQVISVNGQSGGVGTTVAGTYGSLVLGANGAYTYVLANNAAVQALAPGQAASDVFHYTIADGHSHPITTTTTNQNLITQSESFDNAAWVKFAASGAAPTVTANVAVGPQGTAATADQLSLGGADSGLYFGTNVSGQYTFSVWVRLVSGDGDMSLNYYGASTDTSKAIVATGAWQRVSLTFNGTGDPTSNVALMHVDGQTASGTFQFWGAQLNAGAAPTDYVPTSGAVGSGTTTTTTEQVIGADLVVNVSGPALSAPPIAVADAAHAPSSGSIAGNVLANDISQSGSALTVTAVNGAAAGVGTTVAGTYGSLVLGANGAYTYQEAAGVTLAPGQTVTDIFHYSLSDGHSYQQTTSAISGQNLFLQSEAFDNSVWTKFAASGAAPVVTANVAAGPLGGAATADQVVLTTPNSGIYYGGAINGQYTFSVWARVTSGDGHFSFNYFDGTAGHASSQLATSSWQRFTFTFTGNNLSSDNVALMHDATMSTSGTLQFWGAQLNPGATAGDYAATTGHYNSVFANTTTTAAPTGDLVVTLSGPDPASVTPGALTFAGGTKGVVVNLATGQWAHATTVLPLGDSITYGWTALDYQQGQTNTEDGYRGPLWWDFASNNNLINFVGPNTSGDSLLPDQSHAGFPNYRSDQIAALLPGILATNRPDAILLMNGINDIFQETNPAAHVAASITGMLQLVTAVSPTTEVYVATLMPINPDADGQPGDDAMVATVNAAIRTAVSQAQALGEHVTLVDTSSMTLGDIADAAHPTAAGYSKLASIWYNALLTQDPLSGGTPGGDAHTIAAGVQTVIGSEDGDLLTAGTVGASLNGGGGADRLVGGIGADTLTGGTGGDQFVFHAGSGKDVITDFSQTQADHIELDGYGLTSFSQLSSHISKVGAATLIDLSSFGAGGTITLQNFTGTLSSNDFWFG